MVYRTYKNLVYVGNYFVTGEDEIKPFFSPGDTVIKLYIGTGASLQSLVINTYPAFCCRNANSFMKCQCSTSSIDVRFHLNTYVNLIKDGNQCLILVMVC
jgi:hypothetical protein